MQRRKDRLEAFTTYSSRQSLSSDVMQSSTQLPDNSAEAQPREVNSILGIVVSITLYGMCILCLGFLVRDTKFASPTATVNILAGAVVGMWLAARFIWRVTSIQQKDSFKLLAANGNTRTRREMRNPEPECQAIQNTLGGHIIVYTMLSDFIFLPLALALSVFRETKLFSVLGSVMYPPFDVSSDVYFYALFFIMCPLGMAAAAMLYTRTRLSSSSSARSKLARFGRATPLEKISCVAYALLIIPASSMATSALTCEDGYMRFASRIQCHSTTHRKLIVVSLVMIECLNTLMELIINSTCTSVCADKSNLSFTNEREQRSDPLMMEFQLRLRWATLLTAALSGESYRCLLLALMAGLMLHRACRATSSTNVQTEYLHRSVLYTVMTTSLACAVVQLTRASSGYAFVTWFAVWLYTSNTLMVVYYMKWGTNLLRHTTVEPDIAIV